ncbi:MAG: hypothetical protein D6719_02155 [Candidatus Dadabacteria bacterium]|nr:MAG: hypothetical protein D6719_02155 [Candidatus Dadabacteria bacterium]
MEELNEIIASQLSADVKIEQAVAIIRRLLSVMLNTDISHLSASELGNISLSSEQNFLRPLVAFIVKLEELRYAGRLDLKKAEDQLNKLKILLSDIACRYQSIKKKKKS